MKYILTNKDNIITMIADNVEVKEDRYTIDGKLDIFKDYPTQDVNGNINHNYQTLHQVEVPNNVEPQKYCYTEKDGFYKNTDYKVFYTNEERISALEDMLNEMVLGGN